MEPDRALLILLVLSLVVTGSASGSPIGDVEDDCSGFLDAAQCLYSYFTGVGQSVVDDVRNGDTEPDSEEITDDLVRDVNDDAPDLVHWSNTHLPDYDHGEYDRIRLEFEGETDETVYIVVDHSNDSITDITLQEKQPEQSLDMIITLSDGATRNAHTEYEQFSDDYVSEDESLPTEELSRILGRYEDDWEFDTNP